MQLHLVVGKKWDYYIDRFFMMRIKMDSGFGKTLFITLNYSK